MNCKIWRAFVCFDLFYIFPAFIDDIILMYQLFDEIYICDTQIRSSRGFCLHLFISNRSRISNLWSLF